MPTTDRTTIMAAVEALVEGLEASLVADPPTAGAPFRWVGLGSGGTEDHPRPFLTVRPSRARFVDVMDDDKLMEVTVELRIVTDVVGADPLTPLLDPIGAVDDYLDGIRDEGVIEGAEGFDDRTWTLDDSPTSAGARLASAKSALAFIVKVQRGNNREPAI